MDVLAPVYNVGDIVKIISKPNYSVYIGWEPDMDQYCGLETRIADRWESSTAPGGFCYEVEADNTVWPWSADCFESDIPAEDIDPTAASQSIDELFSIFGGA